MCFPQDQSRGKAVGLSTGPVCKPREVFHGPAVRSLVVAFLLPRKERPRRNRGRRERKAGRRMRRLRPAAPFGRFPSQGRRAAPNEVCRHYMRARTRAYNIVLPANFVTSYGNSLVAIGKNRVTDKSYIGYKVTKKR